MGKKTHAFNNMSLQSLLWVTQIYKSADQYAQNGHEPTPTMRLITGRRALQYNHVEEGYIMKTAKLATLSAAVVLASAGLTGCGAGSTVKAAWERYFTGTTAGETRMDWIRAVNVDSYGNVVSAGMSVQASGNQRSENVVVASHTSNGSVNWVRTFDLPKSGFTSSDEMTNAAIMDEAGNTYVAGTAVRSNGEAYEYSGFLIKVDTYGNQVWARTFVGEEGIQDIAYRNGLVYVGGKTTRVYTADGQLTTSIAHGDVGVWDVEADDLGNIYACGDAFVAKFAADGSTVWSVNNPDDVNHHCKVSVTQYGEVYAAHEIYFDDKLRVTKINEYGTTAWVKTFAEPTADAGIMSGQPLVAQAADGSVYAVSSNARGRKLIKLDAQGNSVWTKTTSDGVVRAIQLDTAGNAYVYGQGKGEKFDAAGKSLAKIATPYEANVTTGDAVVVGNAIFVADSLYKDATFTGYVAKYNNQ